MGSFEEWTKVIGGILEMADIEGFLGNSKQLYERASEEVGMWAAFLDVWRDTYGSTGVTSQTIAGDIQIHDKEELQEALPHEFSVTDDNLARKLGRAFGKREGVRYGDDGLYIARAGDR